MIDVRPAIASEIPEAAGVLAEAFEADPVVTSIIGAEPGAPGLRHRIQELFQATILSGSFPHGALDIARAEPGGPILGAAAWEAPGATRGTLARQVMQLPGFLRAFGATGIARALKLSTRLSRSRPTSEHWYLMEIGVGADARGRGVGSALLRSRLSTIDAQSHDAYLESSTPDNRRLYRRHGFIERGSIDAVPGARPMAMLRPAQTRTA